MPYQTTQGHSLTVNEHAGGVTIVSFDDVKILDQPKIEELDEELTSLVDQEESC